MAETLERVFRRLAHSRILVIEDRPERIHRARVSELAERGSSDRGHTHVVVPEGLDRFVVREEPVESVSNAPIHLAARVSHEFTFP